MAEGFFHNALSRIGYINPFTRIRERLGRTKTQSEISRIDKLRKNVQATESAMPKVARRR